MLIACLLVLPLFVTQQDGSASPPLTTPNKLVVVVEPPHHGPLAGVEAHDLAVTGLTVPKKVKLKTSGASVTKFVKVKIQNRSAHDETIPDLATLANLVQVQVTPLGAGCVAPSAALIQGKPNLMPRTLKPKQKLTVAFRVTFDCSTDPLKGVGHEDFSYQATVTHAAIDGVADTHTIDDTAPRPALPGLFDPNPDGKIKDKGVGGKFPDGSLGAAVMTDVIGSGQAPGNDPPTPFDDAVTTIIGEPVPVFVLANDTDPEGDLLNVVDMTQPLNGTVGFSLNVATFTPDPGFSGSTSFTYVVSDGHSTASGLATVKVVPLPPDPATVAPPPENGVTTILAHATEFLYTGPNAIQFGVAPGTIEPVRAAVMRGKVTTRGAGPLSGVRITILSGPQYGSTFSRLDGAFDMAVNGGGPLTVKYEKDGFCPVERQLEVPWQDYVTVPDVAMVAWDAVVTPVAFGATSSMQVHQGSLQSDVEGARQATLLFSPGTVASLVQPDGTVTTMTSLNVRATEFTVGPDGPAAMPGVLPPTSGYTYCVELSADEAGAAGATAARVQFSEPVFTYVENYIGFPVGTVVPVGFYDSDTAAWIPSLNGRVIGIVSISGNLADVDTDGDASADNTEINDAEREQLASLYPVGQSLWRVPITHFTPWDCNWPFGPPDDAVGPAENGAHAEKASALLDDSCECPENSIIETDNQVLGESLPIVGTPYSLNYRSDRIPAQDKALNLTFGGPSVPASLESIRFHLAIAGQIVDQTFPALPDQHSTFVWNGLDGYGHLVQGGQLAVGSISYVYPAVYKGAGASGAAFGQFGGATLTGDVDASTSTLSMPISEALGPGLTDARAVGLGGWTLSGHHFYDPVGQLLHMGNGQRRHAAALAHIITTVAGGGTNTADGIPAKGAQILAGFSVAVAPDGGYYISEGYSFFFPPPVSRIRRVDSTGIITTVAGTGVSGFSGDGGLATQAQLNNPYGVAVAPDGSLYITDERNHRVRRVDSAGIITTVAGTGVSGFSGDGGLATQAQLNIPAGVAVAPDGSLYFADGVTRIRRVGPDGIITTVAGNGSASFSGDGGPATQAGLSARDVDVGPDGSFYFADDFNNRVRRVGPDGVITTVAGITTDPFLGGFSGDGGPATQAELGHPSGVAVAPDGSVYIADAFNVRIRRVGPDGIISTVAGGGINNLANMADGVPATQAIIPFTERSDVAVAADGTLYIRAGYVRRVLAPLPSFTDANIVIASENGAELYLFDASGRHLSTLNALTAAVIREFTYDDEGRLASVTEKTGGTNNVTTIHHDVNGNPTAIIGPFGQVTALVADANGFLASITNPANEQTDFTSSTDGLLKTLTDPLGHTSTYTYDDDGRLIFDADAVDGTQALSRVATADTVTVTRTTALARTTTYKTENLPGNVQTRTITAPDATQSQSIESIDAGTRHGTSADGMTSDVTLGPDPRFGMESPVPSSSSLHFPSALAFTATSTRSAVLSDALDPLSLVSLTATTTVNGHTANNTYTAATQSAVNTTPAGRTDTSTIDFLGRLVHFQAADLDALDIAYDDRGRPASIIDAAGVESRSLSFTYDPQGFLNTATDHLGRTAAFSYDAAGRMTRKTLSDSRIVDFGFDAAGNLTSLTPPGKPAYTFAYSDRNQVVSATPPAVVGTGPTTFAYNADRQMTSIVRPDGQTITLGYDSAGRPSTRSDSTGGDTAATYDIITGNMSTITGPAAQSLAYTYDGFNIIGVNWAGPVAGSVTRTYDASLRLATEAVNGSNGVTFTYDGDDLLTAVAGLTIQRSATNGLPTGASLGVVNETFAFNGFGELMEQSAAANGGSLYGATLTRDTLGRVGQSVEVVDGVSTTFVYSYDGADRLIDVTRDGVPFEHYGYDSNSNRTSATVQGAGALATFDAQDRLLEYGTVQYAFNASGQLVSRSDGAETTAYHSDAFDNLLAVDLPDGTTIAYLVDGLDRRVGKNVNGTGVQRWLYSGDRIVAELDASGTLISRFVYAGVGPAPDVTVKNGVAHRVITDQLGSVRLVVDSVTGAIVQRLDYDSFGNVLLDTNPGFQPFGFAGGLYDADTGLVRFGARDYDAETGRWTAKDPISFAGLDMNLYNYASNDPVNVVDPDGLNPVGDFFGGVLNELVVSPLVGTQFLVLGFLLGPIAAHIFNEHVDVMDVLSGDRVDTGSSEYLGGEVCAALATTLVGGAGALRSVKLGAEGAQAATAAELSKVRRAIAAENKGKQILKEELRRAKGAEDLLRRERAAAEAKKKLPRITSEAMEEHPGSAGRGGGGG